MKPASRTLACCPYRRGSSGESAISRSIVAVSSPATHRTAPSLRTAESAAGTHRPRRLLELQPDRPFHSHAIHPGTGNRRAGRLQPAGEQRSSRCTRARPLLVGVSPVPERGLSPVTRGLTRCRPQPHPPTLVLRENGDQGGPDEHLRPLGPHPLRPHVRTAGRPLGSRRQRNRGHRVALRIRLPVAPDPTAAPPRARPPEPRGSRVP